MNKTFTQYFFDSWTWSMAFRDGRHYASRLMLLMLALISGIAAVVALDSLRVSLQSDVDKQAKALVGADFVIQSDKPLTEELSFTLDSLQAETAFQADMTSMVYVNKTDQTRLIRLVALTEAFPFYGSLETVPNEAHGLMYRGHYALLDEVLANQYQIKPNDTIQLGEQKFRVAGVVTKIPGGGGMMASFTPSVYIAHPNLELTKLVQFGSRVNYRTFLKLKENRAENHVDFLERHVRAAGYQYETVEKRKENLGNGFMSIYRFFSLLGFIALLLGCVGIASAVHLYIREKRKSAAILRCLGASGTQTLTIYFVQLLMVGLMGSILATFLGVLLQQFIPILIKDFIPFDVHMVLSWSSMIMGIVMGVSITLLFSMLPLIDILYVSPLSVLRNVDEKETRYYKQTIIAILLIILSITTLAIWQTRSWITGSVFVFGIIIILLCLYGIALVIVRLIKRYFPARASFVWRLGLSNLFRPNNQTMVLLITIGLGVFTISTLNIVEKSMLAQVEFTNENSESNTLLFDIQPYQKEEVLSLMASHQLPIKQVVPLVTLRIHDIKGELVSAKLSDTTNTQATGLLTREYRVTYRDSLSQAERLIEGNVQYVDEHTHGIGVTLSDNMAERLELSVGDSITFDVQGILQPTFVAGIRSLDWQKNPPNFMVVFPTGVLEHAPQLFVATTFIHSDEQAHAFQSALIKSHPNVSFIDLRLILATLTEVFDKLKIVISVLGSFTVFTGLLVLMGTIANSKYVRIKENIILRTLGASRNTLLFVTLIEYTWVGVFASLTGLLFSIGGGFVVTRFLFDVPFDVDAYALLRITASVIVLTVVIGWINLRGVLQVSPLNVLRNES
jgi:putative ABC transport system permease protein